MSRDAGRGVVYGRITRRVDLRQYARSATQSLEQPKARLCTAATAGQARESSKLDDRLLGQHAADYTRCYD